MDNEIRLTEATEGSSSPHPGANMPDSIRDSDSSALPPRADGFKATLRSCFIVTRRTLSLEPKHPHAIVFDTSDLGDGVKFEEVRESNKEANLLEYRLPRWHNRIEIYDEEGMRYLFTLRLDRVGFRINCKRRLGYDYKVLHVKRDRRVAPPASPCEC